MLGRLLIITLLGAAACSQAALAEDDAWKDGVPPVSIATSLPANSDPGGTRKWLAERGLTYSFVLTSEALANASGGIRQGGVFQGKLEGFVKADLEKMLGLRGFSLFANAFQIHNTGGIRRDYTGSANTISNIEALPTTRLSELWLEQKFFNDTFSVRFGQLAADSEFFISDTSTMFMTSDWPTITALNLPSGAAAYPLSTPGIRLRVEPFKNVTWLIALFNGDPSGPGPEDPQIKNPHGVNFRTQDPPLLISEAQFRYNQDKDATGLAGTIRVGFWHHFGTFENLRFDQGNLSLANPLSSGIAARMRGTSGIYGVIDQQVYRPPGGGPDSGVNVFGRIGFASPDRNPVQFYLDGGIVFSGMVPGRPDDKFGATFLFAKLSADAVALQNDMNMFSGMVHPIRDYELNLAAVYQAQLVPGWTLQPAIHYVVHPDVLHLGGHITDAALPRNTARNATVFALRSVITY